MKKKPTGVRQKIKKVGVVGFGLMGSEYTQLCAQKGYTVIVSDLSDALVERGLAMITARLTEAVNTGAVSERERNAILGRISGTTDFGRFAECDLVVETVTERLEVKKSIFAALDKICAKDIILATNTSVLSVLDIAKATERPEQVLGIHGAPLQFPLAELVETILTSKDTLEVATTFAESLGKFVFVAKDTPGFIINRLLTPMLLSAIRMVETGVATREIIENAFTKGMGWLVGPLGMADGIGLDTLQYGSDAIYNETKDPGFISPVLLNKMVTAGWLGVKTGRGFFEYGK